MVQRYKNPNRNMPRQRTSYMPEYKRHGVKPIPINGNGRVDEEELDFNGPGPFRTGPPLNVGMHDHAAFQVDGMDSDVEDNQETIPRPPPAPPRSKQNAQIEPGEYLIIVNGQIVASGDEETIKTAITSLIYNQSLNPSDMVVLRRMEVGFGVTLG
jgi:hypothetical protein